LAFSSLMPAERTSCIVPPFVLVQMKTTLPTFVGPWQVGSAPPAPPAASPTAWNAAVDPPPAMSGAILANADGASSDAVASAAVMRNGLQDFIRFPPIDFFESVAISPVVSIHARQGRRKHSPDLPHGSRIPRTHVPPPHGTRDVDQKPATSEGPERQEPHYKRSGDMKSRGSNLKKS